MKVGMVNGYKFAPNRISLASKVSKGQRTEYQNSCLVNKIKSKPSWPGSKISYKNVIYQWELTNLRDLRPYWPQTASKFEVRLQMRAGRFCHLLEKCELRFIWTFFIIFENISGKPAKFPFYRRITYLCRVYTAEMAAILKIAPCIIWLKCVHDENSKYYNSTK